ncbi:MAG: c-type cytochrome [Candidatus Acidiferrum sp.]
MRAIWFISVACAVAALYCAACNRIGGSPDVAKEYVRPRDVVDFWSLYNENCSACHGRNGQNGPAFDLANPVYQAIVDDASLTKWITGGMPGTEMPAFGESAGGFLSDRQIDALVAGIRRNWAKGVNAAGAPPYLANLRGDEKGGEEVYKTACLSCHQEPSEQISNASYLALVSDQSLRTIIVAGRPDLGHPDWQHDRPDRPLTNEEVTNVVAYMASLRSATAGQPYPKHQ